MQTTNLPTFDITGAKILGVNLVILEFGFLDLVTGGFHYSTLFPILLQLLLYTQQRSAHL